MNVLVTTAGGGNALNLARSLKNGFGDDIRIVGVNIDRFELAKAQADSNYSKVYLVHPFRDTDEYEMDMAYIIDKEKIDFVIPNHEMEIEHLHTTNSRILEKCFLPSSETVRLCNNKLLLNKFLNGYEFLNGNLGDGVSAVPKSTGIKYQPNLYKDFPYWVRLTKGAGSRGANLIHDADSLDRWLDHWIKNEGVSLGDFMMSEYLPRDDHHYFSLWNKGEMVIGKAIKRIRYCCAKYSITGTSSSPSLCVLVKSEKLDRLTQNIIKAVDPDAQGLFGIDYKGDKDNNPKITEINIGRFPRINYIFNLTPGGNIARRYVELGMGISDIGKATDSKYPTHRYYLVRDFDTAPVLITGEELANMEVPE